MKRILNNGWVVFAVLIVLLSIVGYMDVQDIERGLLR